MSPHLHDLLRDAADDGGRGVTYDLAAIRVQGRRDVRRRRALTTASALGLAAVVGGTSFLLAGGGGSDPDGLDLAGPGDQLEQPDVEGWTPELSPLVDALEARGVVVRNPGGGGGFGSASGGSDEGDVQLLNVTSVSFDHAGTAGEAYVAEFTDFTLLAGWEEVPPEQSSAPGETAQPPLEPPQMLAPCAVLPGGVPEVEGVDQLGIGYAWDDCGSEPRDDGELWTGTGSGDDAVGLGVTLVRSDGSGLSVTVLAAGADRAQLALDQEAIADVVVVFDDAAPVFPPDSSEPYEPEDCLGEGDTMACVVEEEAPPTVTDCPEGELVAGTLDDDQDVDVAALVRVDGRMWMCEEPAGPPGPDGEPGWSGAYDITDWPVAADVEDFTPSTTMWCVGEPGCSETFLSVGRAPEDAARITYLLRDGTELEAEIVDGYWFLRAELPPEGAGSVVPTRDPEPNEVRVERADGSVIIEGVTHWS